jgi:hypothetical protein
MHLIGEKNILQFYSMFIENLETYDLNFFQKFQSSHKKSFAKFIQINFFPKIYPKFHVDLSLFAIICIIKYNEYKLYRIPMIVAGIDLYFCICRDYICLLSTSIVILLALTVFILINLNLNIIS